MFRFIYFIGTGCGRPLFRRQLPGYLIGLDDGKSVLIECGCSINTDTDQLPINIAKIDIILISAADIELFAGLPSLLHSMRLLNRSKPLKIIAPKSLNLLFSEICDLDAYNSSFEIEYIAIEEHRKTTITKDVLLITSESIISQNRYQIYLKGESEKEAATIFYTGKSKGISDPSLLNGHKFIVHDCTYSYKDSSIGNTTGLASYHDVLKANQEYKPNIIFLVHFSPRYKNPAEEIGKHRIEPTNILKTYDGFRYDFINLSKTTA